MKISECLTLAGQPDRIGGMIPAQIIDASSLNNIFNYAEGRSDPAPGDPVHSKVPGVLEARLAELLAGPRAAGTAIVNMEGYGWGDPHYMQDVPTIERKVDELAAWLRTVKAHKQKKTRIAMDYPMPTWDIGLIGQSSRPDTDAMWNKIRLINRRFRAEILPLVGAVCVQAYWCVRWGDITKDLFGEGPIWGNFRMWQVHACALSALTDKPTVALFSPSIVSLDESRFPPRALTEEECGQAMFYLSAMGFSEMVMWGTVEGNDKTPGGWNRYDPAAMETTLRYVGDDGEFLADPGWHYLPTPA